jgi:4-aminobutyrate aminotransferase-like enzyme
MTDTKQILALNRFEAADAAALPPRLAERVARRRATFGASSVLFYREPIEMVRGEGVYLYDAEGRRYLDVYNNVPSVGHCHPAVAEAVAKQIAVLNIHTRYLTAPVETYAEKLLARFPAPLANLVMTCTGSESNDLAMRICETATGKAGFIVTRAAYHGNTRHVTAISPSSMKSKPVPDFVRTIPAPDPALAPGGDVAAFFAASLKAAIAELEAAGHGFAGFFADSIFSSDGIYADPPGFLKAALDVVHAAGGLFVADEVQPGFGRTGGGLWGFSRHDIVPDVVTMGKPMGNGFPMGGVVTRPELLAGFCEETGYFNTFGGNPVAAAAGAAVLDVIDREGLVENAREVGAYLADGLRTLAPGNAGIGAIRGAGLFIGLDFVDDKGGPDTPLASHVINALRGHGILIGAAGLYGNTLKIRPPLPFTRGNADFFIDAIGKVLAAR